MKATELGNKITMKCNGNRLTCMYSVRVLKTCLATSMALEKLC